MLFSKAVAFTKANAKVPSEILIFLADNETNMAPTLVVLVNGMLVEHNFA